MEEKEAKQDPQKQQSVGYKRYYNRRKRYHHKPNQTSASERVRSSFKKISIIIPLYNEEESVTPLSHELRKALSRLNTNYEVILIDDGSTDNSLQKLKEITKTDNRFRYLSFRKNYGKSAALHVGFKAATGDAVVTMDSDLQDDPQEISNLLKKLEEGYDLCSGWKKKRQDPFIKKISSKFFNFVTRVISGIKIHDFNCGLKAYKKEVVENVKVYGELHRYIPVLAKWQGYSITEVPVMHHPRRYGKTKFGISRFFKGFIDLITVIFVTRYIKRPMHFFGFLGAVSFLIGFIILGYLSILWIQGHSLSNRPMIFLGMLLIIVGVQLFAVGLLGEVIVHNSMDDREYVIKDKS
ncbi:MAG: glycosyltransferase family 2 protein [Ignavibacteriaceae bacterium]|nr:glycosyltransferase family 2 protein [Ignavibacteriaceae bacterium]MCU0364929.1 glycosyltransferase family 2 protein [Ignavibacteriaceae bacterium]